uniref:Glutamate receptor ionotropic, kainate 2 n=1 Tax=Strigamia maritima TaxID=126957 RepID=T1IJ46_STRMM
MMNSLVTGVWIISLLTYSLGYTAKEKHFTIGAIFEDDDVENMEAALRHAVERSNIEPWFRPRTRLLWESASVVRDDCFSAYKRACHLLKNGISAILGPTSRESAWQVQSTCSALQIPHIGIHEDFRHYKHESGVNIYPAPTAMAQAVAALIDSWEWFESFTILYENEEGLIRIQELMKLQHKFFQLYRLEHGEDPKPLLKKIMKSGTVRLVIDAELDTITAVFNCLESLGMLTEYYEYVIINYDFHLLDLSQFRQPVINITGFQIIDPTIENYRDILNLWRHRSNNKDILTLDLDTPEQIITTKLALVYDAILLYASAVTMFEVKDLNKNPVNCDFYGAPSRANWKFLNGIRQLNVTGLTGPIFFNKDGIRSSLNIHVIKNIATGLIRVPDQLKLIFLLFNALSDLYIKQMNTWNAESGLFPALDPNELRKILEATIVQDRKLIVTSFLNPPLLMKKKNGNGETEYEGYVVDLLNEMEKLYPKLNFTVRPVLDGKYGDNTTGKWNGMVGELIQRKADLAIADLAITRQRQAAVDFTIPFMHLGIGILYKKSPKMELALFSFLNPFSEDVWIFMATAVLGVSLVLFFLSRVSPYEWDNPHPCDSDPEELENQFNLMNSMWFVIGSLMQQGCDFLPKAVSTRTVASVWWFFNLIIVATYTATLAAFLTAGRTTADITTAASLPAQTKVKYGCVRGGATFNFFYNSKNPIYRAMILNMESADPSVYVNNNDEGIQRVLLGDYAFFMENVFIQYQVERKCNLVSVGSPLDSKGYGIALPKGSPYFRIMNQAVLKLQDKAILTILYKRWWQEKGLENPCPPEEIPTDKLDIGSVGGIFILVTGGTVFACLVGVLEFMWFTHKDVREKKPPMWKAIFTELKFAIWGDNTKPIDKASLGSESGLAMTSYSSAIFGALFDSGDESLQSSFRHAIERLNLERWFRPHTRFAWQSASVMADDSFSAAKKLCNLLKSGVHALIGPQSAKTSYHVQSMCNALKIPHVEIREDPRAHKYDSSVNVFPHPISLARAVSSTIQEWEWFKSFTLIYENNDGLTRMQELLKLKGYKLRVMQLQQGQDCRPLLKVIKHSAETRIIVDATVNTIANLLQQAKKLGMMSEYYEYVLINLDMHTIDLREYRNPVVNITGFQIIDTTLKQFHDILEKFKISNTAHVKDVNNPEQNIKTETALLYDSVLLYAFAISNLDRSRELDLRPISCDKFDTPSIQGRRIIDVLKPLNISGLTGPIHFNKDGMRTEYNVHVIKNTQTGLKKISTWNPNMGIYPVISQHELQLETEASLTQKTLIVSSILASNRPLFMLKSDASELQGNDRYEGYVIDLMDEICKVTNLTYKIRPVGDGRYGDNRSGKWNGMIGELMQRKADVVVADLTITQSRQEAVDFTIPFMNLGISILYRKDKKKPVNLFSFLNPFSEEVWIYMATAYLGISVILFFLARISPAEWCNPHPCTPEPDVLENGIDLLDSLWFAHGSLMQQGSDILPKFSTYEWSNPHPCRPNPEVLENTFNLMNSMWFTIGSLMQQGSDLAPKAVSTRLVAGVWWFFTLIMISSYTANLAAFLTSDRLTSPITNAEDLSKQSKIKYGCLVGGATMGFFKNSKNPIYAKMWRIMESADPSVFVQNNDEGIGRVEKGEYAFLMENTIIEYRTVRNCDLIQVGSLLDNKGYGVATPKGSPYRAIMNNAVLKLQDKAILVNLRKRWWQEKGEEVHCVTDDDPMSSMKLGLANVGGVFVLLTAGMGLACVVGILEFVWNTRKTIREEKVSICTEMAKELKFVMTCSDSTKPIVKSVSEPENGLSMPLTGYSSAVFGRDPYS